MKELHGFRRPGVLLVLALLIAGPLAAAWSDSEEAAVAAIRQIWLN